MGELVSLKLAAKVMGLKDIPESPYLRNLIRQTMTDQIHRYGIFHVHRYRAYYLQELEALKRFDS